MLSIARKEKKKKRFQARSYCKCHVRLIHYTFPLYNACVYFMSFQYFQAKPLYCEFILSSSLKSFSFQICLKGS